MTQLSREEQAEITSQHLRSGEPIEIWLIPFAVTMVILIISIIIIVTMHFVKRRRKHKEKQRGKYVVTESNEMLTKSYSVNQSNGHVVACNGGTTLTKHTD